MKQPSNIFIRNLFRKFLRFASILIAAFMLGISNVIFEENRMINDSRSKVEQQETQNEDKGF